MCNNNTIIIAATVEVKRILHAKMESWSSWSQCSKSCMGMDEVKGTQGRTRKCINQQNGGTTCDELNAKNVKYFSFQCIKYNFNFDTYLL